jgi:hypothetical protein
MAKSNFVQNSFVSGELSEVIKGRTDLDQYYKGMEIATNVVTTPQGGVKRRMGSQFISTVPAVEPFSLTASMLSAPEGGSVANVLDNNTSTVLLTTDDLGTQNPYVFLTFDLASVREIMFVDLTGIKLTEDVQGDKFFLQSSTDNSNWTTEDELPILTNVEQNIRASVVGPVQQNSYHQYTRRYFRIARVGGVNNLGTAKVSMQEVDMFKHDSTAVTPNFKMHKFEVDKANSFLLIFTSDNLRIYRVTDTTTTFLQDVNHGLGTNYPNRVAANENVLLLFNKNVSPKRLVYNFNNDGLFIYDTPTFNNIPQFDFDDSLSPTETSAVVSVTFPSQMDEGFLYQLELDGVLSKEIVYHGDVDTSAQTATANSMQQNLQAMPVFGDSGVTVARTGTDEYTVTMSGDSANAYHIMTGFPTSGTTKAFTFSNYTQGNDTKEDIWSATRGYPNLGVYAQGRLWIGGTRDKPQVLLASQVGNYLDFKVDKGEDTEGFLFTMNGAKSSIVDVTGGRGVTVFTEGAEFSITGNTPATLSAVQQTQHGSFSENVPTIALDGTTLFIDRNGRSIRQFVFDHREEGFRSVDMSVLSSHLINAPLDMDAVTSTTSNDANYVFVINADGSAVVLNTLRDQDINGFVKFDLVRPPVDASNIQGSNVSFAGTTDKYVQCVSANNIMHVLVDNGTLSSAHTQYTVERLTFDHLLDSSIKFAPNLSGGYYHPEFLTTSQHFSDSQPKYLVAGNSVLPSRYLVANTNTIQLTDSERLINATIEIGRNFVPEVKPMPLNTVLRSGDQTQMALKRVDRMNLRVLNSAGVNIDGVAVPVREFGDSGSSPLNTSLVPSTGVIEDNNGGNGWGREVVPKITVPDPTPFHLLAIDYEISS